MGFGVIFTWAKMVWFVYLLAKWPSLTPWASVSSFVKRIWKYLLYRIAVGTNVSKALADKHSTMENFVSIIMFTSDNTVKHFKQDVRLVRFMAQK